MSVTLVAVLVLLGLLWVLVTALAMRRTSLRTGLIADQERKMAAQAEVEAHDIDEMIEARNALRARIGKPSIGDELARDVLEQIEDERDD